MGAYICNHHARPGQDPPPAYSSILAVDRYTYNSRVLMALGLAAVAVALKRETPISQFVSACLFPQ